MGTPVLSEQIKAAPEIVASVRPIDEKQRASNIIIDFTTGNVVLNCEEGQEVDGTWIPVGHPQITLTENDDLLELLAVFTDNPAGQIMQKLADFVLAKTTEPAV